MITLSAEQLAVWEAVKSTNDNLIISAVAGGAKTTTMVEIAKLRGNRGDRVVSLAFNKDAQLSLEAKMPYYVQSQTFHSFCLDALGRHLGGKPKIDGRRCAKFLKELVPSWKERVDIEDDVLKLVSLAKAASTQCESEPYLVETIADYYGIAPLHTIYAQQIIDKCLADPSTVDFDDMLWLTLKLSVKFPPVALYILDESQDTNAVQRALLERMLDITTDCDHYEQDHGICLACGKDCDMNSHGFIHDEVYFPRTRSRLIAVGDPHQSIYGFRGADSDAMALLQSTFNMTPMELSVSYRCSQKVVEEARKFL